MAKKDKKKQADDLAKKGLSQPQGFTHGMISDLDPHFQLKGSYSDAKNIRLTNAEGDTFTVENIEGNSLFVDLATFPISVNAGEGSSADISDYPTFYDRGSDGVDVTNNLKLDNRASIVGHVSYANQMLLMIVARFEWDRGYDGSSSNPFSSEKDRTIFLMVDFDKEFKVSKVSDLRVCYSEGSPAAAQYPDLGMDLDNPVRIEHIIENDCISRIYWTDNKNPLRTLNVKQERLDLLSKESLDLTPLMDPSQPSLHQTLHGSLPVGVYQYSYKYISENGGESTFSPLSNVYHVSDQAFGSSVTYSGGPKGNLGTQGFTIKVSDIDPDFEYMELYALFYEDLNQPPRVALVGKNAIDNANDTTFQHTTWNNEIQNGLEEILIESNTWDVCKDIAIKDNILFAANLKQKKNWISEKEWNVKVMRWSIAAGSNSRYLDAMLTTDDREVRHYEDIGAGPIEIGTSSEPVSYKQDENLHHCGRGQILGSEHIGYGSGDSPSAYPSLANGGGAEYLDYDGNLNNPMWTTCHNQRHGAGGTEGVVKHKFEYRYLSDRMTLGAESFNFTTNGLGGARVSFGVKQREADQTQNTSTSPYISASTSGEVMQTDNVYDFINQSGGSLPYTDSDNTGTKFKTSMSLGGTKDPHAAGNKRGYQRGEVYRFGVQTYDLTGAPGNVLWIGDIQTPEQYDLLRMIDITQQDYTPFRPSFYTDSAGTNSLIVGKNIVSHPHIRDHRLSYVFGHQVPPVDVEWFSGRLTNSLQNLDAYVMPSGSQFDANYLPDSTYAGINSGRRKGVTRDGASIYAFNNAYGDWNHGLDHDDTHYLYDLYVNFEFIIPDEVCKKISGFRVVRAIRGEEDRSIIQQGLLNQTAQYGDSGLGLEAGYGNTKFSREDNEAFDDDPVFVNQFNDPDNGVSASKVEQPEYNTYLNGYLGLAENSNLAFYRSAADGVVTSGGNTVGYIASRTESEVPRRIGNKAGWAMPNTSDIDPPVYSGPGSISPSRKHSSYFGSYDKRVSFTGGKPKRNAQGNLAVSGSIYTLDSPDSAFGIRPYTYREGDSLRIDCVMKLTNDTRYKNHDASWGLGAPAYPFTWCAPSMPYSVYDQSVNQATNDLADLKIQSQNSTETDLESLHFSKKRHINKDYSVLIGKYYCFEPYFGIGMEIDGGRFAADKYNYTHANRWQVNTSLGWHLPISAAKEISDGEIVPSGFFKKSNRVSSGAVLGFSNNTLGFYRSLTGEWGTVPGSSSTNKEFFVYDGVYSGVSKMNGATTDGTTTTGSIWADIKEEDYTYDTVSTLQMGLRSILIEVNTNVSEVRKYSATGSYWENRSGHTADKYSSWFACPNVSAIYEQQHWYGQFNNGTELSASGTDETYVWPPISQTTTSYKMDDPDSHNILIDDGTNQIGFASLMKRSLHPHKYLCSIVRKVTPYQGWTKSAIEKTRYIPCGNFHPVKYPAQNSSGSGAGYSTAHVSQVFGGDTFVNLYSHQKTSTPYMKKSAARWQVFPVESYINTDMRSGLHLNSGDTITGKEMNEAPFSNDWLYNSVYSQENSIKSAVMVNEDESCESLDLPYEIAYSNTKILGQKADAFRVFPINQFHDMEGLYGEINRIINFKNEIYIIQDSAFAKLLVNPISMLSDDSGTSLFTGTGETVENHIYISTKYGTRHRFSVALSEKSLYFVDSNFGRLFKYDTEKLISLGDALGQRNYLKYIIKEWEQRAYRVCNDTGGGEGAGVAHVGANPATHGTYQGYLDSMKKSAYSRNYFSDNPLNFLGITSIFDYRNKELLITFHNSSWASTTSRRLTFARVEDNHSMGSTTVGEPVGISETLVYNEGVNAFIAKYSVTPPQWLAGGQGTFIVCPENELNINSIANFHHTTGLSYITSNYGSQWPYDLGGSIYDSVRNRRCNPLRLWLWDKHDEEKKTHFFGKKDDFIRKKAVTSHINGSTYSDAQIVEHAGTKDVPDESYIVKVINSEAAYSKSFDNAQIVMTPSDVPFSDVNYLTDTTNDVILTKSVLDNKTTRIDKEEELVINRRWDFDDTMDGWFFKDSGSGYPTPIINTGLSTITLEYVNDSHLYSPNFKRGDSIDLVGKYNNIIRMRVKRTLNGNNWEGNLFWYGYNPVRKEGGDHVIVVDSSTRVGSISEPDGIDDDFVIIEWDMSDPTINNNVDIDANGWNNCIINRIRIDLSGNSGDSTFEVDWIEIGGLKADKYSDGVLKLPLRTEKSIRRTRGTWAKIKYTAKTTDKFNIFAILAKYRKIF